MSSRSALFELHWSSVFHIFRQSKSRGLCKRWKSDSRPAGGVEERDKNLYGGWKSYDLLVESGQEPSRSFVKRWDWHAWQFIVSLMPATGIYLVAKYIESDREATLLDAKSNIDEKQGIIALPSQRAERHQAAIDDTVELDSLERQPTLQLMKERLDAVESMLNDLLKQQTTNSTASSSSTTSCTEEEKKQTNT